MFGPAVSASVAIVILLTATSAQSGPFAIVDQEYAPGTFPNLQTSTSAIGNSGQTFTPTLSSLDAVEMNMTDFGGTNSIGATFQVVIHDGGAVSDPVLGTSLTASAPDGLVIDFVHFDFASSVPLTPGSLHTIEVFRLSGDDFRLNGLFPGFYGGGQMNGNSSADLYFRTGQHVPEPASALLIAVGGILFGARRQLRKRQRQMGPALDV